MNFLQDLKQIAETFINILGISFDNSLSASEIIEIFVNIQLKLIQPFPRKVIRSTKIQSATLDAHTTDVLNEIENKSINGKNLNPHLSKTLLDGEFTDHLFADWNIYHFHLNTEIDGNYFVKRSKDVLFVSIFQDVIYFIDIRPHGKNGEKHVFAQKELLEIIYDEWPWILEPYRLKGITYIETVVDDPKDIEAMRKAGVNIIQKIRDGIFAPMGGGITTAKTSVNARIETDRLIRMVREAEKYIKEPIRTIIARVLILG